MKDLRGFNFTPVALVHRKNIVARSLVIIYRERVTCLAVQKITISAPVIQKGTNDRCWVVDDLRLLGILNRKSYDYLACLSQLFQNPYFTIGFIDKNLTKLNKTSSTLQNCIRSIQPVLMELL
ncbi:hypothetical protein RRG08_048700 [Elysia crispata]|uniref:Uncharacterized protein n=1 Tax=Elysia crispata TaxID=231223 RepID=A0AAE1A746_9GAST|nr:hypothetical protein RRG08_048700 [Elysia crispata]